MDEQTQKKMMVKCRNTLEFPNSEISNLLHNFRLLEQIGRGHLHISAVNRAFYKNKEVAVKLGKLYKDGYKDVSEVKDLFEEWNKVRHENVVKMFAYAIHKFESNFIAYTSVMELMSVTLEEIRKVAENQTTAHFIDSFPLKFIQEDMWHYDISHTLAHLHDSHPSLSAGLSTQNIFFDPLGNTKIAPKTAGALQPKGKYAIDITPKAEYSFEITNAMKRTPMTISLAFNFERTIAYGYCDPTSCDACGRRKTPDNFTKEYYDWLENYQLGCWRYRDEQQQMIRYVLHQVAPFLGSIRG